MAITAIAVSSCGREPTDPSRSSLTGFWKSFDYDLYIHDIEIAQIVLHLFGAGDFVGERTSTDELKGIIRSREQNFHVTFTRF